MDLKKGETEIPFLDFKGLEEGSDRWKDLCSKVVDACEDYGCFQVAYNKIPSELREDMFKALKELFDLPVETKAKNATPKPNFGYVPNTPQAPLYENIGLNDVPMVHDAQAFTKLMWPEGNPFVCETLNDMGRKLLDLELMIRKMVFENYGVGKHYNGNVEASKTVFRLMKYRAPPPENDSAMVGLVPHTDKGILTILSQNEVNGLAVLTKQGQWVDISPLPGTFVVFVGESFKAWSNGRLHAAKHKVMMNGDKDRYTYALFVTPKEGAIVEAPKEFIDQHHPLRYRPFDYYEYLNYFFTKYTENSLEVYAGV